MRISLFPTVLAVLPWLAGFATADRILESRSLRTCQKESALSASLFHVVITPNNSVATVDVSAVTSVNGKVVFDVALEVYGHQFTRQVVNPCDLGDVDIASLCPMVPGDLDFEFNFPVGDALDQIPGIAYGIPDLDATVRAFVNLTDTGESVACVEADFDTGKTVEQLSVKWVTAAIIGLGLIASATISLLGYSNAAAHLAANTLSLFAYFQAQAIVGFTGIHMPPIVEAWTQNFQWSMGIIKVGWMQDIFTWYQRATGGNPANLFDALTSASVQVMKRSMDYILPEGTGDLVRRNFAVAKRDNIRLSDGSYLVYGIQRVAFRSKIETTNLFLTSLVFFLITVVISLLLAVLIKLVLDLCVKRSWAKGDRFLEFRTEWRSILKGITLRLVYMAFPPITILCLWEFTQIDSPALAVFAVFFFFGILFTLCSAAIHIIRLAWHTNPTLSLFSDSRTLNKWGFLYVQFRASGYYFIAPLLFYNLLKGMFVALGQHHGVLQAVALIFIEAAPLITATVMRPYMDGSTDSVNIAMFALNFLNAILLLLIANPFDGPAMMPSICGLIFFVANGAFSLILLLMTIISTTLVFWRKNPDTRYAFMADDRMSFMKSQTQMDKINQLDALAATARLDKTTSNSSLGSARPRTPTENERPARQ